MSSGGCGKPGHVTAGSEEGTQWCATCAEMTFAEELAEKIFPMPQEWGKVAANAIAARGKVVFAVNEALERAAQECEDQTGHTGETRKWFATRVRALKSQGATVSPASNKRSE